MDADFSVELGPPGEDATLELPWDSGVARGPRYLDLKRQPELLPLVEEAVRYPELAEFLKTLNSRTSAFTTAKCDVWSTDQLNEEEQIYGAEWKLGSYVDLVFAEEHARDRFSYFRHEELARALAMLLKKAPELPAACEVIVRRCYYHEVPLPSAASGKAASRGVPSTAQAGHETRLQSGFYLTLYIFGYGDDEEAARERWAVALRLVANALLQLCASLRHC
jgi:hypothetical protein